MLCSRVLCAHAALKKLCSWASPRSKTTKHLAFEAAPTGSGWHDQATNRLNLTQPGPPGQQTPELITAFSLLSLLRLRGTARPAMSVLQPPRHRQLAQ